MSQFILIYFLILGTLDFIIQNNFAVRQLKQISKLQSKKAHKNSKNKLPAKNKHFVSKKYDSKKAKRKLASFFHLSGNKNSKSCRSLYGGVNASDGTKIKFAKPQKNDFGSITINTPPAMYPTTVLSPRYQKPIVLVHEILEPDIKKRVFIHHEAPFMNQYHAMAHSINPHYLQMANQNPYYQPFIKDNPKFKQIVESSDFSKGFKASAKHFSKG